MSSLLWWAAFNLLDSQQLDSINGVPAFVFVRFCSCSPHCSSGRLTDACVTLRFDHEIKTHHEVLQCFHLLPAHLVIPAFLPYCDLSLDQERRTSSKFIGSLRLAILEIRCEESDG
jgi:hypothetical protein